MVNWWQIQYIRENRELRIYHHYFEVPRHKKMLDRSLARIKRF